MTVLTSTDENIVPRLEAAAHQVQRAHKAAAGVIYGQDVVIERTLITLLSGGHALLIGVPGLAKTLLVDTLGKVLGLDAKRIQFTPDLMPSDIIGAEVLEESATKSRSFRFIKGPIFTQLLMADEINRASPKTQSAQRKTRSSKKGLILSRRPSSTGSFFRLTSLIPISLPNAVCCIRRPAPKSAVWKQL
jgi:MoxR-like ATPase